VVARLERDVERLALGRLARGPEGRDLGVVEAGRLVERLGDDRVAVGDDTTDVWIG